MEAIKFYREKAKYGEFSNFSNHPIFLDGRFWKTTEHYYQAQKFVDTACQDEIHQMDTPMAAARYGRRKEAPRRADWDQVKDTVMRAAVEAKIKQHADVRALLVSTGDLEIIEHTKNDFYWGDGGDGSGKNMLGKILMEVREKYKDYDDTMIKQAEERYQVPIEKPGPKP